MLKLVLLVNLDPWVVRNFLKHSRWQREKRTKRCAEAYQSMTTVLSKDTHTVIFWHIFLKMNKGSLSLGPK